MKHAARQAGTGGEREPLAAAGLMAKAAAVPGVPASGG